MSVTDLMCCCFPGTANRDRGQTSSGKGSSLATAASNLTKIFEELKCPICFNVCIPPIYNCLNGHIICNSCRQKGNVTSCPTCREALNGARNYFAENFVVNYAQQCRYTSQGCDHIRMKGCNMKPHEEKCMFRPLRCIVASCTHEIPYKGFLSHLDNAHRISGTNKLPTSFQFKYNPQTGVKKFRWFPYYIQIFGNVYYVMMHKIRGNFWIWGYYQPSKEADDLEYSPQLSVKLKHPEKKIVQSWHGPVYPIRTPFKTIMSEGCCLVIPEISMNTFASRGNLYFTVDIQKLPRRSLKGIIKVGGDEDESDTTGADPSLPSEYKRSPSFYEPNLISENPQDIQTSVDENGNITVTNLQKMNQSTSHKTQRTCSAAIGILRRSKSQIVNVPQTSIVSAPPAHLVLSNDDVELPDKDYIDKIPSDNQIKNTLGMSKSSVKLR